MEVKVDVRLNGIEEKLQQIGPKLARSHLKKALTESMKIIEVDAKARAPVDTGELRNSIKTVVTTNAKQDKGVAKVGPTFSNEVLKKGSNKDQSQSPGVYGLILEFGNKRQKAQPFLRPSFDSKADSVVDKFAEVLGEGLLEATK